MPDPYDYTSAFANLPSPQAAIMDGVKNGVLLTDLQAQQQQQRVALAQQQKKQQAIQALINNPDAGGADYAKATLIAPELHAQFKQAWDMKSTAQQQNQLSQMTQWSAAIQSGQPKIASDGMRSQADAIENTAGAPTPESKALRAKADQVDANPQAANFILKSMIAANPNGSKAIDGIVALGKEQRDQDLAPAAVDEAKAKAAGTQADNLLKNQQITAQKASALAKVPGLKPEQVQTFLQSEAAAGRITPDNLATFRANIPTDPKALPGFLNSLVTGGMTPKDSTSFTTPTADAKLQADTSVQTTGMNNATSVRTTGMNNATQVQVQKMIGEREDSKDSSDAPDFTPAAIDNAAARYNLDGTLPPMGMGKAASAGRTAILNRAAEMKAGVDPEQQRRDQLGNKGQIASQNKAVQAFTSGKLGSSVRSFNVGLSHLDTLGNLADALGNKDTQAVNRIGNYFATQTGSTAPTSFNAAKKIVGDEIVKAIVGSGGGVHDREEAAKVIDGANSPAQLKSAINTYKELMVGQLGGLEQQYRTSTGMSDFERYLSPQALAIRKSHGGGAGAPGPSKVVNFGDLK